MDETNAENLYNHFMDLNKQAFDAGYFDAAYHALAAAYHCAVYLKSNVQLTRISSTASEQLKIIDKNYPDYSHSTQSAKNRGHAASIFAVLSKQVEAKLQARKFEDIYINE